MNEEGRDFRGIELKESIAVCGWSDMGVKGWGQGIRQV